VGKSRKIRCSVSSFAHVGALIDGTAMLATVPVTVARQIRSTRPHLATKPLPFEIPAFAAELLWPAATDDDEACTYVRARIRTIAAQVKRSA
jgi:LysR family transcriptional activator of mexEF-oprN operon